jgi:hypothetical protein
MDGVVQLPDQERADLFRETAARKGLGPVPIEKDFWVCWILKHLFTLKDQPPLIFKGGTSLSKGYGLIERFSEDIDLAFDRAALGFTGERDPEKATSGKASQRLIKKLQETCIDRIKTDLVPSLQARFESIPSGEWTLEIDHLDGQEIRFRYPASLEEDEYGAASYVSQHVLLEVGARSDHSPAEKRIIQPYAAEEFPDQFENPTCEANTLAARRTFWEKVTLLHALHNRPNLEKRHTARQSRHYYDLYMLARSSIRVTALQDLNLLRRVADHKTIFFRSGWAGYADAANGNLRMVPHEVLEEFLRRDYDRMSDMFFDTPPSFDDILAEASGLETDVNSQLAS